MHDHHAPTDVEIVLYEVVGFGKAKRCPNESHPGACEFGTVSDFVLVCLD